MYDPLRVKIENTGNQTNKYDLNVERGMFRVLRDLIELDTNIIWDPVGAFFSMSCGYSVHKYNAGGGAVYDPDGAEIFLTQNHINMLFAIATTKTRTNKHGLGWLTGGHGR